MIDTLTSLDRIVLRALLGELETLAEIPDAALNYVDEFVKASIKTGVPFSAEHLLGHMPTPAERMRCTRTVRRLADLGLLMRVIDPKRNRARYLRLTSAGLQAAMQCSDSKSERTAVIEGIRRLHWGQDLLAAFVQDTTATS